MHVLELKAENFKNAIYKDNKNKNNAARAEHQKLLDEIREKQEAHQKEQERRKGVIESASQCHNALRVLGYSGNEISEWIKSLPKPESTLKINAPELSLIEEVPDDSELRAITAEIVAAGETNQKAEAYKQYLSKVESKKSLENSSAAYTAKIEALDKQKNDAIAAAKFPVAGLSFTDTGVLYNGIPFSQCSSAEKLRVSVAIAMAGNPKLRVIRITDGSLIDSKNMAIIESLAKENDYQIWIEKVDESGSVGVYIEDGQIKQ